MGAANPPVEMGGIWAWCFQRHKVNQRWRKTVGRDVLGVLCLWEFGDVVIPDSQGWGTHSHNHIKVGKALQGWKSPPKSWSPTIPECCQGHSDPFPTSPAALFALHVEQFPPVMGACPALSQEG